MEAILHVASSNVYVTALPLKYDSFLIKSFDTEQPNKYDWARSGPVEKLEQKINKEGNLLLRQKETIGPHAYEHGMSVNLCGFE